MAEKVTTMVLKVDLQCARCYRKIKKILCNFPEIGDQVYDKKQNTVTITVPSCNPEKIRDELCCKGGKIIKCIEIKKPPEKKEDKKPTPVPISVAVDVDVDVAVAVPKGVCCGPPPCSCGCGTRRPPPCSCGCGTRRPPPCSCGCGTGRPPPCSCGCGTGRPPPCSCGCGTGRPPPCSCGRDGSYRKSCYSRCDFYFSEENPSGCAIM